MSSLVSTLWSNVPQRLLEASLRGKQPTLSRKIAIHSTSRWTLKAGRRENQEEEKESGGRHSSKPHFSVSAGQSLY